MNASLPAGRTVLVTGAAKRIGREIALLLASAGWRVALHYRNSKDDVAQTLIECAAISHVSAGDHAIFQADLGDESAARDLIPRVISKMGVLDSVVNSASIFEHDTAENFNYETLDKHMRANVGAPVILSQGLFEHIKTRGGTGCVVNLLDQKLWNVNPDFLSYSFSKSALKICTTMLAQQLTPYVRVCAVAPGLTYPSYMQSEVEFQKSAVYSLLQKITDPIDIAKSVRFLLDTPSITGSTLIVDCGQHLTPMGRDVSFLKD
jgi:NAD(P)-dependent dehydrogenase (short-subunit alcohol dehydrogenase family)